MSNEIVKYENRLNSIPLRKFNSREMNIFFSIASRVRDKGDDTVTLTFNELKSLSKNSRHGKEFVADLSSTYDKMLSINAWSDNGDDIVKFVAFTKYHISRSKETVDIAVNPDFRGLFNDLSQWTRFSLKQFADLDSTYAKTMFRLLKQYRTVGRRQFNVEDFRDLLDIPDSYRSSDIDKRVLKPIKEELAPIFKGLAVQKKRGSGRGGRLASYTFSFKPERKDADDFSHYDERIKINTVNNNADLTKEEKTRSIQRILGMPLGTGHVSEPEEEHTTHEVDIMDLFEQETD
ncbi:replication initiation protein [uncultured Secundilactobacillus sp.]|uniref:replication initiation protein n=1 Tax=uncultured Secundilactobacillus sp. TaxID=2813935 RepID=UPI002585F680|nr:replication initiation protein [uncultured Secundilactobacillus sp.]